MDKVQYEQMAQMFIDNNPNVVIMLDMIVLATTKRQAQIINGNGVPAQIEYLRQQFGEDEAFRIISSKITPDDDDDPYNVYG